jgi:tetratricopeptide (TPR) repeat protein
MRAPLRPETQKEDTFPETEPVMKRTLAAVAALALLASVGSAQSKLDQAVAKALEQVQKGKPEDAVKTMTKAAAEAGAEGQLALARLHERLGNLDEAQAAYSQAKTMASGPGRSDVLAAVANFTLRKGSGKDALAIAREAVAASPSTNALAAEARALVRTEDGPGGLAAADKAMAAGTSNAMAHIARGEALTALGRNAEAEQALKRAVELDPKSALAYSRLGRAQVSQSGRITDALASARRATELEDKFGEGFAMLGLAVLADNPKNWSDAIAQAQQGAFLDPGNPLVQVAVGKIFEANGQLEQAAGAYRKALQTDPGFAPARLALIQAELNRGNRDVALAEAKKVAAEMPTSPEIQMLIGEMAIRKGDYPEALAYLERAMKGLPGNADGWALLGRAYHYNRRYDEAADAYKKAVALTPLNASYRATLGLILGQAGELDEGLAELQKVTSTPGYKDAAGWANLGWVYRNLNKAPESIAAYQKALALDPKEEQAALGLGWAYQYIKNYDQAIAAYNQAIQIDPKDAAADANIGIAWCYFFKRDMAQARVFADKAATAGRSVTQLKENIEKVEKQLAAGMRFSEEEIEKARAEQQAWEERNKKLEAANNAMRSRNPATRARAARDIASAAGPDAVPALVVLMQSDPNFDVRIAATNALGSLGPAARSALPNIDAMLRQPPYEPPINATTEQLDAQMKDGDYKRALRDARARIGR